MNQFIRSYLKLYGLCIGALFFHVSYVWYCAHYWDISSNEPVDYSTPMIALALLCALAALAEQR